MYQFYYFLRRILFTVIANPSCPFTFNASFIMLYIVLFYLSKSIYGMQINIKILGDKVFHCVFREEIPEFRVELRCERLVRRHDERRNPGARNDVRHREGLSGPRDAKKRLPHQSVIKPLTEFSDCLRLIAAWLIRRMKDERRMGK